MQTTALSLITAAVLLIASGSTQADGKKVGPPVGSVDQLIFFAVLEGLYRDGAANEDVDIILRLGADKDGNLGHIHFVYGCPLCTPALNAFVVYRARAEFPHAKGNTNTLGDGFEKKIRAGLRHRDPLQRLATIQSLIDRWVHQRLESKRLTPAELTTYDQWIKAYREKGMEILKAMRESGTSVFVGEDRCAVCEGAVGGSD